MNREEILAAFRAADERIERLRPHATAAPDTKLATGEWTVRDALSHVAARSDSLPMVQRWVAASQSGEPRAQTMDIHEINAGQVRDRSSHSVAELMDEIITGHAATVAGLDALDDAFLAQKFKASFRPDEIEVGQFVVMGGVGHEGSHLGEIDAALGVDTKA